MRNAWISESGINVYVRRSHRFIGGTTVKTLDIANVEVKERFQRQGIFKNWLAKAEALAGSFDYVFVENVLNEFLQDYLSRNGYASVGGIPPSYVKAIKGVI